MEQNVITKHQGQRIALVLQGGGALGAYQAGVYEALQEHDLTPDWVVGTSIGAINAAIIAGNHQPDRIARLRQFWESVSYRDLIDMRRVPDKTRQLNIRVSTLTSLLYGVPGLFRPRVSNVFASGMAVPAEMASFYDTSELAQTLARLVDLECLNGAGGVRLTVNALKVTTGELVSFDSRSHNMCIDHVMASGALPPGFPPVRINGELYWDGGLFSNTPLETVLEDEPRVDTLCFMVDLWSAAGPEPCTFDEVQTRTKDVTFASRSKFHIDDYLHLHALRRTIRMMYESMPPALRTDDLLRALEAVGADSTMHIVRLAYAGRDWHMASKDINFSRGSMEWRWQQGYQDAKRVLENAAWLRLVPAETGVVVHDMASPVIEASDIPAPQ